MTEDPPYELLKPFVKERDDNRCRVCGKSGFRKNPKTGEMQDFSRVVNVRWPEPDSMDTLEVRCKAHSKGMD